MGGWISLFIFNFQIFLADGGWILFIFDFQIFLSDGGWIKMGG